MTLNFFFFWKGHLITILPRETHTYVSFHRLDAVNLNLGSNEHYTKTFGRVDFDVVAFDAATHPCQYEKRVKNLNFLLWIISGIFSIHSL